MFTDFDRMKETFKELAVAHSTAAKLNEPKTLTVSNPQQGTKAIFVFNKDGKYQGVLFE